MPFSTTELRWCCRDECKAARDEHLKDVVEERRALIEALGREHGEMEGVWLVCLCALVKAPRCRWGVIGYV